MKRKQENKIESTVYNSDKNSLSQLSTKFQVLSEEGEDIIRAPHHPSWIMFTRLLVNNNNYPRVVIYINVKLIKLYFLLRKNIFNHWNINLISFFNHNIMYFIINVYSDDQQTICKYLKDDKVNLNNIVIMTENFNIRDNN